MPDISITHVPHLNGSKTPARCNRLTGQIWINDSIWRHITPAHRYFILLHELGHIKLNTSNELEADEFAFKHFVESGYPLTESVKALSRVLTGSNQEHVERVATQLERAKKIDSKNPKKKNNMCNCTASFNGSSNAWYDYDGISYTDSLFGLGKRAKAKKDARIEKKKAKNDIKLARAEAIRTKATAQLELAKQGITKPNMLDTVANTAVGIFGKGGGEMAEVPMAPAPMPHSLPEPSGFKKWLPLIIGGVAVLGVVLFFVFKKK